MFEAKRYRLGAVLLGAVIWTATGPGAQADTIDFESGYAEEDVADTFVTPTNVVTVTLDSGGAPFIAQVGEPQVAFKPDDTPSSATDPGQFFLTSGSGVTSNYGLAFGDPVVDLSVDVYDVAGDQSANVGDQVVLSLYADAAGTQLVGSDVFTVLDGVAYADGHSTRLSVSDPVGPALSAEIAFLFQEPDTGNGIDNITFTTSVPEPGTIALVLLGIAGLGRIDRRR